MEKKAPTEVLQAAQALTTAKLGFTAAELVEAGKALTKTPDPKPDRAFSEERRES